MSRCQCSPRADRPATSTSWPADCCEAGQPPSCERYGPGRSPARRRRRCGPTAAQGQIPGRRRSTHRERLDVVQLDLVPGRAATAGVADERALATIALPDLGSNGHRDIPSARRRRLRRRPLASPASPPPTALQGHAQTLVQHLLQPGPGQLVRQRLPNRLEIGSERRPHRDPQDVTLQSDRLEACLTGGGRAGRPGRRRYRGGREGQGRLRRRRRQSDIGGARCRWFRPGTNAVTPRTCKPPEQVSG
jgi:hypothetical protein